MKKVYLIFTLVLMGLVAQTQNVFNNGDLALNVGIGALSAEGFIPSINLSGEMGIFPTGDVGLLAVGAIVAYKYSTYSYAGWFTEDYNYHQFTIGPRAIWHLHTFESDQWDAYAGAGAGLRIHSEYVYNSNSFDLEKEARFSPYVEAFVGGRMMLNDGFGLFAEAGYGTLSAIKVGATLMF